MDVTGPPSPEHTPGRLPEATGWIRGRFRPVDVVVFSYLALIALVVIALYRRVPHAGWLIAGHLAGMLLLALVLRCVSVRTRFGYGFRNLYIAAVMPCSFSELGLFVHEIRGFDYDWILVRIDRAWLGVDATVWLERLYHPVLAEVSQVAYSTFYFLPLALALALIVTRQWEAFEYCVFVTALGFFLSYLGYLVVPAVGPRFTLAHLQTVPLQGSVLFESVRHAIDSLEAIKRDCFPSGHTEMTLVTLYYAWRFHKKTFAVLLPIGSLLILATVYLRYHYAIDVVAGAVLAALVLWAGPPLYAWLKGDGKRTA